MKKGIAILGTATILFGCSSATVADTPQKIENIKSQQLFVSSPTDSVFGSIRHLTMLEEHALKLKQAKIEEAKRQQALYKNKIAITNNINNLHDYIGKTWYVFSGSTPSGWDCSGLVRWFYSEIGIEVPHSASKQGLLKPKVKDPLPGDIVVFKYNNAKNFIHSGIYIGDNNIIHAGFKKGDRTEIISIDDPSFDGQQHYFVRILELPNE